jgi:hypothetical protein
MSARLSSVFPRPSASDPDDVVWTLQTAAVQWQRGLRADAIVWVRKAADLSTQIGRASRAEELRNHAARLAEYLWTDPEEPLGSGAPSPPAAEGSSPRRVLLDEDDDEEIIEVEELEGYELEFTETDLPTPEDAVSDISPEDLSYYQDEAPRAEPAALPDDLDLRSDSELPMRGAHDSFLSVQPEAEKAGDSFISVYPDSESPDGYLEVSPESVPVEMSSLPPPPQSDYPTRPRIERPPAFAPAPESTRLPTVPSPPVRSAPPESSPKELLGRAETVPPPSNLLSAEVSPADAPPGVDGLAFESVETLADLPEEAQQELAGRGRLVALTSNEEFVLREGAALITRGQVHVTLPFSDVSGERVSSGAVVAARGSIEAGPLRLIADAEQTHLVTWSDEHLSRAMRDCPWVVDDLRILADRLVAHASAGLGPLGERLDDALRAAVYERLQVRVLSPDESIAERGKPLKGLFVVAVGELNVGSSGDAGRIGPGQFVFPGCVIGGEPAPHDVKASPQGNLVLFATRPVAHELMMSVPPLLEILAS